MPEPITPETLAKIRRNDERDLRCADEPYGALDETAWERHVLLVEVDRLHKAVDLLGTELQKGSADVMDALREAAAELREDLQQEVDRLRRGMRDLHALWRQRAIDNGDYYNRTAEKYEHGKAVAFDAAAEEIRLLIGEASQAVQNGGKS